MNCCNDFGQCTQGHNCPARPAAVAPIKVQRRSCEALGVCRSRTTACKGCTPHEQAAPQEDLAHLNQIPTTGWDRFWFYGTVSIATACTVAMVFGASGWVYASFIA